MTLQLLISTYAQAGLDRTAQMQLPQVESISYLVSVQNPSASPLKIPSALLRSDIQVLEHPGRGLSANRNFSLDHASGDVLLIADDDLIYTTQSLGRVLQAFENDKALDFATFRYTGADKKTYPSDAFDFTLHYPKGFYLTSFEIAVRRASLPSGVRFPLEFGIGAPYFGAGEEDLFVRAMIRSGMRGRFIPHTVAHHPEHTTGSRASSAPMLRAQGALMRIHYGMVNGLVHLLRDIPRRNTTPLRALRHMLAGFIKISPRAKQY